MLYFDSESESLSSTTQQVTKIRLWFKEANNTAAIRAKFEHLPIQIFECKGENNSRHPELQAFNSFIEFIPSHSGKDKAITELAQTIKIPRENILVVGDDENDYRMITRFDGYTVEGSRLSLIDPRLKTVSSVAALIEQHLGE